MLSIPKKNERMPKIHYFPLQSAQNTVLREGPPKMSTEYAF